MVGDNAGIVKFWAARQFADVRKPDQFINSYFPETIHSSFTDLAPWHPAATFWT
jgi:hypothetical protein